MPDDVRPPEPRRFRLVGVQKDAFDVSWNQTAGADPTQPNQLPPAGSGRAVASNVLQPEDEYQRLYVGGVNDKGLLAPPFSFRRLEMLASSENNALSPCVEAMVTNIEKTGYSFTPAHQDQPDGTEDAKSAELSQFFAEVYPGVSFIELRERVRRDMERTGNGYVEVVRNGRDEILYLRHADAKMMRMVKLDAPTVVAKTVTRKGKTVAIKTQVRERRFAQMLNGRTVTFFREFGASRDLDKTTGKWAAPGERMPPTVRATEIMHFKVLPDAYTPYGLPRWISQVPSVLGSRRAEEFNLDFFDNGGVPPILILLNGGSLTAETRKVMEEGMNRGAKRANRVQIVEAEPSGGAIDQSSTARITVERFGHERQNDSMFENYDAKCEARVRRAFRLAPIFVGDAANYSFATAYASYTVCEAQVFKPERDAFDERISLELLPALGYPGYRLRSKPLHISDSQAQLSGVTLANQTNYVEQSEVIRAINDITGLDIKVADGPVLPWLAAGVNPTTGLPDKTVVNAAVNSGEADAKLQTPSPGGKGATRGTSKPANGTPTQTPSARAKPKVTAPTPAKKADEALGGAAGDPLVKDDRTPGDEDDDTVDPPGVAAEGDGAGGDDTGDKNGAPAGV